LAGGGCEGAGLGAGLPDSAGVGAGVSLGVGVVVSVAAGPPPMPDEVDGVSVGAAVWHAHSVGDSCAVGVAGSPSLQATRARARASATTARGAREGPEVTRTW